MNGTADLIDKLGKSELYRRCESAFSEATGLPMAIRPIDAWKHPFHGRPNENDFCWVMASKARGCFGCLRFHEKLAQDSALEARALVCHFGLAEVAAPIRAGGQTIGHLLAGQCANREPTDAEVENVAARAKEFGFKPEVESVRAPYRRTPVVSQKKRARLPSRDWTAVVPDVAGPERGVRLPGLPLPSVFAPDYFAKRCHSRRRTTPSRLRGHPPNPNSAHQ